MTLTNSSPVCFLTRVVRLWLLAHLRLTEHTRFVYNLQDTLAQSEAESESESDSSYSRTRSRNTRSGKKRMSLLTGEVYDVPLLEEHENGYFDLGCGHEPWANDTPTRGARRHFFQGAARWDPTSHQIIMERERAGVCDPKIDISAVMLDGGRVEDDTASDPDPGDEMEVDSEDVGQ